MRVLYPLLLLFTIVYCNALKATPNDQLVGKEINSPDSTVEYWTPERLQSAKPMPLPQVNEKQLRILPKNIDQNSDRQVQPFSIESVPPTEKIKLDFTPLFKINDNETGIKIQQNNSNVPGNTGTLNEPFSSSRLVPITSDIYFPYAAVGKLFFTIPNRGNFVCSAAVIRKRIIVTAGHCVHSGVGGASGYFTNFLFIPAYRDGTAPYYRWTGRYVLTTAAWISSGGIVPNAADFGMIELNDLFIAQAVRPIATITGSFGFALSKLAPNHAHLLGYPCNLDACQKMHQVTAASARQIAPNNVEYGSDMGPGSSGGPWVQNFGSPASGQTGGTNPVMNQIIGITSWGYVDPRLMAEGSSIPDSRFAVLYNAMCSHRIGNC